GIFRCRRETSHSIRFTELWSVTLSAAYGCGVPTYAPSARVVNVGELSLNQICMLYFSRTNRVVVGEFDLEKEEGAEQIFPVPSEDMFVHPSWNPSCVACGNDIALVRLSHPVKISDKVQLSCLPPAGELLPNNYPCYASGWGRLYTGGPIPDILQQALLPVVDYTHCSQRDWWGSSVKPTMVCAGGDICSVCNGDSGGPLDCQAADGRWYVHGVTSFVSGYGCNTLKKPSVFTRVSAFNSWIQQ
ncbi:hypothetical protein XELAEV_18036364mg, partial [Xenopus laevis]